jgi:hypothetical protein
MKEMNGSDLNKSVQGLLIVCFCLATISVTAADTNYFDVLKAGGSTYSNVMVRTVTPTDIIVSFDGGGARIALTNLTPDLQKRFGYDPAKAAMYAAKAYSAKIQKSSEDREQIKNRWLVSLVKVQYDKFNKATTYKLTKPMVSDRNIDFNVLCATTDDSPEPQTVTLHITSSSSEWRFLTYSHFVILYDSKRLDKGELEHNGSVHENGVLEQFFVDFPLEVFKEIASAKTVEAKLGSAEINFGYQQREVWRGFCEYLDKVAASTNVSTPGRQ